MNVLEGEMATIFEMIMLICFGLSWPISIHKSWKSRTTKGKSLTFEVFILIGYLAGIMGKILANNITYVVIFYAINSLMVSFDICLYFRNRKIDQASKI